MIFITHSVNFLAGKRVAAALDQKQLLQNEKMNVIF
jgi:hypothetical protein